MNPQRVDDNQAAGGPTPLAATDLDTVVGHVLAATPFIDIHTHLYPPSFGDMGLWGIDELLTYHYLEAELFRSGAIRPDEYWNLDKRARADVIWRALFVDETPISEATRGVVAVLHALGLDTRALSLDPLRRFFRSRDLHAHIADVFRLAGVSEVVMTNDPLDVDEVAKWNAGAEASDTFRSVVRIDRIVNDLGAHVGALNQQGYAVSADASGRSGHELRRFLASWIARMRPLYLAVSLPSSFAYPADDARTAVLRNAVLPVCLEFGLPLSLMIGVKRQVNPAIRLAGDGVGRSDLEALAALAREFPGARFLVSALSRENQHELCVLARKFSNIMLFGCWWFLNNPSIVEEMTRERIEMLGMSFIPQHSDARVLEQLIYKWRNTRRTMTPILASSYRRLIEDGRSISTDDIRRDVTRLFRGNFERWTSPRT